MKRRKLIRRVLIALAVLLVLSMCTVTETSPTATSMATRMPIITPTPTPDPCTGWTCTVTGVIYAETAQLDNQLDDANVTLHHTSYCSPTSGQRQTTTDSEGRFEFSEVFFHDTDRIQIQVESEEYEATQWDSTDFYCLYCSCFEAPLEIVMRSPE